MTSFRVQSVFLTSLGDDDGDDGFPEDDDEKEEEEEEEDDGFDSENFDEFERENDEDDNDSGSDLSEDDRKLLRKLGGNERGVPGADNLDGTSTGKKNRPGQKARQL